jgi:RNA polymerase sigma factor (sigma-70 family)
MASSPEWPIRVGHLCVELRSATSEVARNALQGELWVLLHLALHRYLAAHSTKVGRFSREDLEDVAAQKSLELLRSAECGSWEPSDRTPGEIAAYLSSVARNGLVDHARRVLKSGPLARNEHGELEAAADLDTFESRAEGPEAHVERDEFVRALKECTEVLNPKSRTIWFFRVFHDMASKEIAVHPEVGLKSSHVDVVLQRCRDTIRDCMKRKGHTTAALPPGTFVELWKCFRMGIGATRYATDEVLDVG